MSDGVRSDAQTDQRVHNAYNSWLTEECAPEDACDMASCCHLPARQLLTTRDHNTASTCVHDTFVHKRVCCTQFYFRGDAMVVSTLVDALQGDAKAPAIILAGTVICTMDLVCSFMSCCGCCSTKRVHVHIQAGGGSTVTRSQLLQHIVRFAGVLQASGIRPGDAVSLADTNTVKTILAC